MCLFAIRDVLKVTQSVKAVRLRCSSLCSKTRLPVLWCPSASWETLKFLPVDMSWRWRGLLVTLPCLDLGRWMSVGGQRYAPLILYVWYFTRTKAHVFLQKHHVCLTDFLGASKKKNPRLIRSRLHAVVIYLPEHSACIEQMLKQFPSWFNTQCFCGYPRRNFRCMC
jgi:hypothetical protein